MMSEKYEAWRDVAITTIRNRTGVVSLDSDGNRLSASYDDPDYVANIAANRAFKCNDRSEGIDAIERTLIEYEKRGLPENRMTT